MNLLLHKSANKRIDRMSAPEAVYLFQICIERNRHMIKRSFCIHFYHFGQQRPCICKKNINIPVAHYTHQPIYFFVSSLYRLNELSNTILRREYNLD